MSRALAIWPGRLYVEPERLRRKRFEVMIVAPGDSTVQNRRTVNHTNGICSPDDAPRLAFHDKTISLAEALRIGVRP